MVLSFAADSLDPDVEMLGPVLTHLEPMTTTYILKFLSTLRYYSSQPCLLPEWPYMML